MREVALGGINTTWENLQIEKYKSVRWAERTPSWFVLFDLQIFSGGVKIIPRAQPHAQSLFLFPIVFGINLIHFFDEKDGAAGYSIVCFGASIPCHAIWQKRRRTRTVSKSATYLATESVNSAPFKRGVRERGGNFWQGNVQKSSPILRCTFWQGKVQNSSPISALLRWRHFRLTLSLSLSLSLSLYLPLSLSPHAPHAQYRKRFRASYNKRYKRQTALKFIPNHKSKKTVAKKVISRFLVNVHIVCSSQPFGGLACIWRKHREHLLHDVSLLHCQVVQFERILSNVVEQNSRWLLVIFGAVFIRVSVGLAVLRQKRRRIGIAVANPWQVVVKRRLWSVCGVLRLPGTCAIAADQLVHCLQTKWTSGRTAKFQRDTKKNSIKLFAVKLFASKRENEPETFTLFFAYAFNRVVLSL